MSVRGEVNRPPVPAPSVTFTNPVCQWCFEWPCTCARHHEEPCACGGSITPLRQGWPGILEAVRAHQATEGHAYWSFLHYRVDEGRPA